MQNIKKALFIGRFQPFHNGHLQAIKDIASDDNIEEIIIGIGSSQYSDTLENPYTITERETMIKRALKNNIEKPHKIIAIPDIHNERLWVGHVEDIVKGFDVVYSGNDWVKDLFKGKQHIVRDIKIKIKISGTKLREMILDKNDEWKNFVPKSIICLVEKKPC